MRAQFLRRIENTVQNTWSALQRTQARFNKNFDQSVRKNTKRLRSSDYIYTDASDLVRKHRKLDDPATGRFTVIAVDKRPTFLDHDRVVERTSTDRATYAQPPVDADSQKPDQLMTTVVDKKTARNAKTHPSTS